MLVGANLSPMSPATQQAITTALTAVWGPANGIREVSFVNYATQSAQSVLVEVYVTPVAGQAPTAAAYIVQSVNKGLVMESMANEGAHGAVQHLWPCAGWLLWAGRYWVSWVSAACGLSATSVPCP